MSYVQFGVYNSSTNNGGQVSAGAPGYNDGVNWPYNTGGDTPNFQINWNSNPPPSAQQIEQTYEALMNWLQYNTGSPAFYNGSILFLQMTVDIGQHLGQYSSADQTQLKNFLANQISTGGNQLFLQLIVDIAARATAVETGTDGGTNGSLDGLANAQAFLQQLEGATSGLSNIPPFSAIYSEASNQLDDSNDNSIRNWIFGSPDGKVPAHYIAITSVGQSDPSYAWVDDEGPNGNEINGQQPISFGQFTQDAQYILGSALTGTTTPNSSVSSTINGYYQTQIEALIQEFKGNPWALLVALMSLINDRDQDNGTGVNSYGETLNLLKQANGIVQKMLGDISGTNPNAADFYAQLAQLKQLVQNDPALSSVLSQFQADIGTINNQTVTGSDFSWTISSAGYYNFPPGSTLKVNDATITVPPSGVVYIAQPGNAELTIQGPSLTFGQLAAMGDTDAISNQMSSWENDTNGPNGSGTNWSSTIMTNFENGVTGIQTLLNSPSAAIQQQIQSTTQTMQAEENFEKEAFDSITNVNQQVMKLVQSVMG